MGKQKYTELEKCLNHFIHNLWLYEGSLDSVGMREILRKGLDSGKIEWDWNCNYVIKGDEKYKKLIAEKLYKAAERFSPIIEKHYNALQKNKEYLENFLK